MDKLQPDVADVQTGLLEGVGAGGAVCVGVRVAGVHDVGGVLSDCGPTARDPDNIMVTKGWRLLAERGIETSLKGRLQSVIKREMAPGDNLITQQTPKP